MHAYIYLDTAKAPGKETKAEKDKTLRKHHIVCQLIGYFSTSTPYPKPKL